MNAYMNATTPQVGERWHAGEVMMRGSDLYMVMADGGTWYRLSYDLTQSGNTADPKILPGCNAPGRKGSGHAGSRRPGRIRQDAS